MGAMAPETSSRPSHAEQHLVELREADPPPPASVGVEPWRAVLFGPMADQPSGGGSCARGRRERWGFLVLLALVLVGFGLFLVLR